MINELFNNFKNITFFPFLVACFLAGYLCVKLLALYTGGQLLRMRVVRLAGGMLFCFAGRVLVSPSIYFFMLMPLMLLICLVLAVFIWMTGKPDNGR